MAKALTYEEVAEKAQSLVQQNINPSIRAVQALLGGRSTDDIARHMKKWHEERSATMQKVWRMPDSVSAAVDLEIERRTQEIEAKANEARMQASTQTDELLQEVEQLHDEERAAWAKERVVLQTDAEVGRRDSVIAVELREQAGQLRLEIQKRIWDAKAKDDRIAELGRTAESADAMRERACVAETESNALRTQLEDSKRLHGTEGAKWQIEQVRLQTDADIGRRDSEENVELRESIGLLTSVSQHCLGQADILMQRIEALELCATSVQELEDGKKADKQALSAMREQRDIFEAQAKSNFEMLATFLERPLDLDLDTALTSVPVAAEQIEPTSGGSALDLRHADHV